MPLSFGKTGTQMLMSTYPSSSTLISLVRKTFEMISELCKGKEEKRAARTHSFQSMRDRVDGEEGNAWRMQKKKSNESSSIPRAGARSGSDTQRKM